MSRKRIRSNVDEQLQDVPPELGPSLVLIGDELRRKRRQNHHLFLDKEQREARGSQPLSATNDVDIRIITHGREIHIERDDPRKPGVKIPVGISDKITTATMPHEWLTQIGFQAMISLFDGDTTYAWRVVNRMNEWIDDASIETDDGRLKIDQSLLPQPKNAVDVAEMMDSLKRTFKSQSHGTTQLNLKMTVREAAPEPTIAGVDPTQFVVPIPAPTPSVDDTPDASHQPDALVVEISHDEIATADGAGGEDLGVSSPPTIEEGRQIASMAIRNAIGVEARTIGEIRKVMGTTTNDAEERVWKSRLNAMVRTGEVVKTGTRRSCRYSLCEGGDA